MYSRKGTHLDDRTSVWRPLLHFGGVRAAVLKHRLVVVDVSNEDHHDGGARVQGLVAVHAARAIINGSHVQFIPANKELLFLVLLGGQHDT